jgi:dihydroxyacetone kinase-like protein
MVMKKFINNPADLTAELLEGLVKSNPGKVKLVSDKLVCAVAEKSPDKVAVVTLGGAGHEPALSGFVGKGALDISVVGDIFAAPGMPKVMEALESLERPAGTLLIVLNHAGDMMTADMTMKMAEKKGLKVKRLNTNEDIAPGVDAPIADRRGLVGCVPVYKLAGAAAEKGYSLEKVYEVAEKFSSNMATLSVAMKGCTHPATGEPIAELADDEMEIGMGQHGEGGGGRCKIMTADDTAKAMFEKLIAAIQAKAGDKLLVMINGTGSATLMEQYIVFRAVSKLAEAAGKTIEASLVGDYLTVQRIILPWEPSRKRSMRKIGISGYK